MFIILNIEREDTRAMRLLTLCAVIFCFAKNLECANLVWIYNINIGNHRKFKKYRRLAKPKKYICNQIQLKTTITADKGKEKTTQEPKFNVFCFPYRLDYQINFVRKTMYKFKSFFKLNLRNRLLIHFQWRIKQM